MFKPALAPELTLTLITRNYVLVRQVIFYVSMSSSCVLIKLYLFVFILERALNFAACFGNYCHHQA